MHAKKSLWTNSASQNVRAKKALGQHFLTSGSVAKKLVDSASVTSDDIVVEIGPGKGMITNFLLQKASCVIAVEKDKQMIEYLKEKFSQEISSQKLILVHDDILNFKPQNWKLEIGNWKLIGAIPYYITGALLKKILSEINYPSTIALIIQKEVAQRIVARDNKESILSISVKAYGAPHYIEKVPRKLFSPEPNVDSAIISIQKISKKNFESVSEKKFFTVLKSGFAHKRKMLKKNLESVFPKEKIADIFSSCSIQENARSENLSLADWNCVALQSETI